MGCCWFLTTFTNNLKGCGMFSPGPSKPSLFQSSPTNDLSSSLPSCRLNTCKKYYRVRLPEHGTWPFQVSEPTSNKPAKTIHWGCLPGWSGSSGWLTDNCSIRVDKRLQRRGVFREGGYWSTPGLSWTAAFNVSDICVYHCRVWPLLSQMCRWWCWSESRQRH